jgi:seryl-tRNA synthetase
MIDLNDLRKNPAKYQEALNRKRIKFSVSDFLLLDSEYRSSLTAFETAKADQNRLSKEVPKLQGEERQSVLNELKNLGHTLKDLESTKDELAKKWRQEQLYFASLPHHSVPSGASDADNVELYRVGDIPCFNFTPLDHVTLGNSLSGLDIARGVKVAGARSFFLKGSLARLQHAVHSYALDFIEARGFTLMSPPHIVREFAFTGTGYFPGGEESAYHLDKRDDDMYLIGTAEVPLCTYFAEEFIDLKNLPIRVAGLSPCYRREAGTYGKDSYGLYRVHQFAKVEQVVISFNDADDSLKLHDELLKNSEDFLQSLTIPYRVVTVCDGDMGQGQVFKKDIECWMPSRNSYAETHSCSSFHDFQARRLEIKYRDKDGNSRYCYTLNNTLVATPRILIPLLENLQLQDGRVAIPQVLQPYMRGELFLT